MKIYLIDSIVSPDWLKYGFTGLVAVFGILMYLIFKPLIREDKNKKLWIVLFVAVSFVLLTMGGLYVYNSDKLKSDNTKLVDSLNLNIQDLTHKLAIYSENPSDIKALREKIDKNRNNYDSLVKINKDLEINTKNQQGLISDFISKSIIESIKNDLTSTEEKGYVSAQNTDVDYKRLQRAVFLNFQYTNGDKEILRQALNLLQNQTGEIKTSDIQKLLSSSTHLMQLKLSWLEKEAIPKFEQSILNLRDHPEIQESANVSVLLPKEIWILPDPDKYCNTAFLADMVALKHEEEMLSSALAHN